MKTHKSFILSIDIGTSSLKAGIFDYDGMIHALWNYPHDKKQLPWANLQFLCDFKDYFGQINAIGISAQSPSIIPLMHNGLAGTPLFYFQEKTNLHKEGCISVFLPKAAYHKKHYRDEYEQTAAYLSLGDYLVYLLTGKTWTSLPQMGYAQAVWAPGEIEKYGLDQNKFPPYLLATQLAGYTTEELPCPSGIAVLGSTYDFLAALEGLDALHPQIAADRSGSSLGLNFFFEEQHMDQVSAKKPLGELAWNIYPHARKGTFNAGLVFPDFGDFLQLLGHELKEKDISVLLGDILPALETDYLREKPQEICQSFLELWRRAKGANSLERARCVFGEYGRILHFVLHHWPLCAIEEIRCSGGPNENEIFRQFKERATGLACKLGDVAYAELRGNMCRVKENYSSK